MGPRMLDAKVLAPERTSRERTVALLTIAHDLESDDPKCDVDPRGVLYRLSTHYNSSEFHDAVCDILAGGSEDEDELCAALTLCKFVVVERYTAPAYNTNAMRAALLSAARQASTDRVRICVANGVFAAARGSHYGAVREFGDDMQQALRGMVCDARSDAAREAAAAAFMAVFVNLHMPRAVVHNGPGGTAVASFVPHDYTGMGVAMCAMCDGRPSPHLMWLAARMAAILSESDRGRGELHDFMFAGRWYSLCGDVTARAYACSAMGNYASHCATPFATRAFADYVQMAARDESCVEVYTTLSGIVQHACPSGPGYFRTIAMRDAIMAMGAAPHTTLRNVMSAMAVIAAPAYKEGRALCDATLRDWLLQRCVPGRHPPGDDEYLDIVRFFGNALEYRTERRCREFCTVDACAILVNNARRPIKLALGGGIFFAYARLVEHVLRTDARLLCAENACYALCTLLVIRPIPACASVRRVLRVLRAMHCHRSCVWDPAWVSPEMRQAVRGAVAFVASNYVGPDLERTRLLEFADRLDLDARVDSSAKRVCAT